MEQSRVEDYLKHYFTGPVSYSRLQLGNANDNYKVQVNQDQYFFRIYLPQKNFQRTKEQLLDEISTLLLFKKAEFPVAIPIQNKESGYLTEIDGTYAALFHFLEGTNGYGHLHEKQFHSIGKLMAKVHNFTEANNLSCSKTWTSGSFWLEVQKAINENSDFFKSGEITAFKDIESKFTFLECVKQYWIHGDFQFSNLLFDTQNEISGWLDFDAYRLGHFAEDIVRLFVSDLAYTPKNFYDLKQEHVKAFIDSYRSERALPQIERDLMDIYLVLLSYWQIIRMEKKKDSRISEFRAAVGVLKTYLDSVD